MRGGFCGFLNDFFSWRSDLFGKGFLQKCEVVSLVSKFFARIFEFAYMVKMSFSKKVTFCGVPGVFWVLLSRVFVVVCGLGCVVSRCVGVPFGCCPVCVFPFFACFGKYSSARFQRDPLHHAVMQRIVSWRLLSLRHYPCLQQ